VTATLISPCPKVNLVAVSKDLDEGFQDILAELDREEARVKIRMEMRRFGKPTTVIEGVSMSEKEMHELSSKMKRALATGGTVKNGILILQGDHRESAAKILKENGFSESAIEVI
jgi:translation initiation factor 1